MLTHKARCFFVVVFFKFDNLLSHVYDKFMTGYVVLMSRTLIFVKVS